MYLDELDLQILKLLQENGRISISRVSEILNKPRTTIASRISRLESYGIISSYKAVVDLRRLGFGILALVLISVHRVGPIGTKPSQVALVERIIRDTDNDADLPWVEEAFIVTGRYDILLKVWARDLRQLSKFLISYLPTHSEIAQTETMIVLEPVADWRDRYLPIIKITRQI